MSATRVDSCGCDESLELRRQVRELTEKLSIQSTSAPAVLTCARCGLGCNAIKNGLCIDCVAREFATTRDDLRDAKALIPDLSAWLAARHELHLPTIAAIQADARVGMAEAELAKAWEAGRDAAADHVKAFWYAPGSSEPVVAAQQKLAWRIAESIRALQPPGGKAK